MQKMFGITKKYTRENDPGLAKKPAVFKPNLQPGV